MISPGPDFALVTRNTVVGGRNAGAWTSAGILSGNLVHLTYCLLGIGLLIAQSIVAFTIMKLAGGAYLIFLGWQSLRPGAESIDDDNSSVTQGRHWYVQGLLNNLLNPKGPLFYLGVLAVFVHSDSSVLYLILLACTTIGVSAGFWVLFVYVLQIARVRKRLQATGRWVNRVLGAVLAALGVRLWFTEAPELP